MHRGKNGCLLPKPQERVDSISNSHASRTLPLPLRPASRNDKRLAFVFALNYRLDCGSANSACRVRPTLAAHRPQTKTCPRKERRGSQTRGLHIPDLRGAQQQELQVPTRAHQSCWRLLDRLFISHSPITTSRIHDTLRNTVFYLGHTFRRCCLTATSRITARPIPRGHAASQPSPLQLQPAISPQLLGLEWLTKRYCRC